METEITQEVWKQLTDYITQLDWGYIITFIVIAYGFNHAKITKNIKKVTKVSCHRKYRIALVGLFYGVGIYFLRGYTIDKIEVLFQSFVFAIVFHKFIIDGLMKFLGRKLNASSKQPYQPRTYPNDNEMV